MTTFKENNSQFWAHTPENILGPHSRKYSKFNKKRFCLTSKFKAARIHNFTITSQYYSITIAVFPLLKNVAYRQQISFFSCPPLDEQSIILVSI